MCARPKRINDMAPVELAAGQKIQCGGNHSYPRCYPHGMQVHTVKRKRGYGVRWCDRRHQPMHQVED